VNAIGLLLKPVPGGWAVALTDGRELVRFTGPLSRYRAERWLHLRAPSRP
jgi:hypothetical protein